MTQEKPNQKWTCQICTYANHPATKRCAMCYTDKVILSNPEPEPGPEIVVRKSPRASPPREQTLSIKCNDQPQIQKSPHVSPNVHRTTDPNNLQQQSEISENQEKWSCSLCTFKNFIASQKCVMCGVEKPTQKTNKPLRKNNSTSISQDEPVSPQPIIQVQSPNSSQNMHDTTNEDNENQFTNYFEMNNDENDILSAPSPAPSNSSNDSHSGQKNMAIEASKIKIKQTSRPGSLRASRVSSIRNSHSSTNSNSSSIATSTTSNNNSSDEDSLKNTLKKNKRNKNKQHHNKTRNYSSKMGDKEDSPKKSRSSEKISEEGIVVENSVPETKLNMAQEQEHDQNQPPSTWSYIPICNNLKKLEYICNKCTFQNKKILTNQVLEGRLIKNVNQKDQSNVQSGSTIDDAKNRDLVNVPTSKLVRRYRFTCEVCHDVQILSGPEWLLSPEDKNSNSSSGQIENLSPVKPLNLLDICQEVISPSNSTILSEIPLTIELIFTPLTENMQNQLSSKKRNKLNKTLFHLAIFYKRLPVLYREVFKKNDF